MSSNKRQRVDDAHPYDMQHIPVPVRDSDSVYPVDALGMKIQDDTSAKNRTVLAYDYACAKFVLEDGVEVTHGKATFGPHMLARPANSTLYTVPPLGRYATTPIYGDCRVLHLSPRAVQVLTAARVVALLPTMLTTVAHYAPIAIGVVTVALPCGMAFVIRDVHAIGGAMGLVDTLLELMAGSGIIFTGDPQVYEVTLDNSALTALRFVRSCDTLCLEMTGLIDTAAAAPGPSVTLSTTIQVREHHRVFGLARMSPWVLPCALPQLLERYGVDVQEVPPCLALVPPSFCATGQHIDIARTLPTCSGTTTVPADVLVSGLRSLGIAPCSDGRYCTWNKDSSTTEITCPINLRAVQDELDDAFFLSAVLGDHNVRDAVPLCPETLLIERFGSAYDTQTGIYTSTV
jgi:hypothetical protein